MSAIRLPAVVRRAACLVPVLAALMQSNLCFGQMGFGSQAVGGISVDAAGIVRTLEPKALESLAAERTRALADAGWSGKASESRTVSLKAVAAAVTESVAKGTPLPAEVQFLGGLQRIERVFVDPDGHDILLCGPADALAVDGSGAIVGARSGRPPLHLEDLIVCLRAIEAARAGDLGAFDELVRRRPGGIHERDRRRGARRVRPGCPPRGHPAGAGDLPCDRLGGA